MKDMLIVAEVLKPVGIRGEIKVKHLTDSAEDFLLLKTVFIDGTKYQIMQARYLSQGLTVALKGVADRNAAELLRGKSLFAPRESLPKLEKGRYYIADLIGLEVYTDSGFFVGAVTEINSAGGADVIYARADTLWLFPYLNDLVLSVDTVNKKITLSQKRFEEVAVNSPIKDK